MIWFDYVFSYLCSGAQPAAGGWAAAAARWGQPSGGAPPPPPGGDNGNFGATNQLPPGVTSDTRPLLAREDAGGAPKPTEDYSKYAFYNIRRYRPYFDVDTKAREGGGLCAAAIIISYSETSNWSRSMRIFLSPCIPLQEVLWRVLSSIIGAFRPNFMDVTMEHPDL